MPPLRVLHCPTSVAGHPHGLALAERAIGLASVHVCLDPSPHGFASDEVLFEDAMSPARREALRFRLLWRALREFDVVHFNFGQTLMPEPLPPPSEPRHHPLTYRLHEAYVAGLELRDLPLLRRAGKGVFVTFQGDDARQGDFCLRTFALTTAQEAPPGYYSPESDARKRRRIAAFDRYAHGIFALNPDLLHVLPGRAQFLPYAHLDLDDWRPPISESRHGSPLIVHAPTWRGGKGTRFVLEAVERLRAENLAFEFQLVEGLPHAEARRIYERADLGVDQLLAGWYGGFAHELMALGKPIVAYIRQDDLRFVPPGQRDQLPVVCATPGDLADVLRKLLVGGREQLAELGRASRAYVERWHNPAVIAARLRTAYDAACGRQH